MAKTKKDELVTLVVRTTVRKEDAEAMKDRFMEVVGEFEGAYWTQEKTPTAKEVKAFNENKLDDDEDGGESILFSPQKGR
jgi:hypothetical protein